MRSHVWMAVGLAAGLLLGLAAAALAAADQPTLRDALTRVRPLGTLFLNLLQMVVIPLVATALFSGIAKLGELRAMGRLVWRALAFFLATTAVAIVIGLAVAVLLLPRVTLAPEHQAALRALTADTTLVQRGAAAVRTGPDFLVDLVPSNPLRDAVEFDLLPVIVFIALFAVAAAMLPAERRAVLTDLSDAATEALIRIVHWVLLLAPVGIFALVAPFVAAIGWDAVRGMFWFIFVTITALALFVVLVYLPLLALVARVPPGRFLRVAAPALLMAFSTTSSLATLPAMLQAARQELRIPGPIAGFVLPLGASLNRAGSALFQIVAVLFVAQVYAVPFGPGTMLQAAVAVLLASFTVASVPSASVVSLVPAFATTGLPIAGLSVLLGLDRIPDMFRTTVNVTGHLTAAAVVTSIKNGWRRPDAEGRRRDAETPRR